MFLSFTVLLLVALSEQVVSQGNHYSNCNVLHYKIVQGPHVISLTEKSRYSAPMDYESVLAEIKSLTKPELMVALYARVAVLYFYRFHRAKDREGLRKLLKEIRRASKIVPLLPVAE
jgi:hypothetical protein